MIASTIEKFLGPGIIALSIWVLSISLEGKLLPAYLLLSALLFSLAFPGKPKLHMGGVRLALTIAAHWMCLALLLSLVYFPNGQHYSFSFPVVVVWFLITPFVIFAAHLLLRALAPTLNQWRGTQDRTR